MGACKRVVGGKQKDQRSSQFRKRTKQGEQPKVSAALPLRGYIAGDYTPVDSNLSLCILHSCQGQGPPILLPSYAYGWAVSLDLAGAAQIPARGRGLRATSSEAYRALEGLSGDASVWAGARAA